MRPFPPFVVALIDDTAADAVPGATDPVMRLHGVGGGGQVGQRTGGLRCAASSADVGSRATVSKPPTTDMSSVWRT